LKPPPAPPLPPHTHHSHHPPPPTSPLIPDVALFNSFWEQLFALLKTFHEIKIHNFLLYNNHFLSFSQTLITSKSQLPFNFDQGPSAQVTQSVSHGIEKMRKGALSTESVKFLRFLHEIMTTTTVRETGVSAKKTRRWLNQKRKLEGATFSRSRKYVKFDRNPRYWQWIFG
jgi:hypothetical protein